MLNLRVDGSKIYDLINYTAPRRQDLYTCKIVPLDKFLIDLGLKRRGIGTYTDLDNLLISLNDHIDHVYNTGKENPVIEPIFFNRRGDDIYILFGGQCVYDTHCREVADFILNIKDCGTIEVDRH